MLLSQSGRVFRYGVRSRRQSADAYISVIAYCRRFAVHRRADRHAVRDRDLDFLAFSRRQRFRLAGDCEAVRSVNQRRVCRLAVQGYRLLQLQSAFVTVIVVREPDRYSARLHDRFAGLALHRRRFQRESRHIRAALCERDCRSYRYVLNRPLERRGKAVARCRVRCREDCAVVVVRDLESFRQFRDAGELLRHLH